MSPRWFCATGGVTLLLWTAGVFAQTPPAAVKKVPAKAWSAPRTPDGHPDLQGVWTNATITPFERPSTLAGETVLSASQAAELEEQAAEGRVDRPPPAGRSRRVQPILVRSRD